MTVTQERTIVETGTPGWYQDPATGKKTRKQNGDRVLTRAEFEKVKNDATDKATASKAKDAAKTSVLTTGKVTKGPTTTITCAKRGCSEKRTIQVQDKFQVKFCIPHQKEHRNELRRQRRKTAAKASK